MKTMKNPILPICINLPERVLLDNGTMFVTLRTLSELEKFWEEHKDKFEYACEGWDSHHPTYLRDCEWVFGKSKSTVISTVMRWKEIGVGCEFYEWEKKDPSLHEMWFRDQEIYRNEEIIKGTWSGEDEAEYKRRSPENYLGWWILKNLPGDHDPSSWLCCSEVEEIIDPNMPITEVEIILQEQTFDDWKEGGHDEITCHDRSSIEKYIAECTECDYH